MFGFGLAEVPVDKRQQINDTAYDYVTEQLIIADIGCSILNEFGVWNTKDKILTSKYSDQSKAEKISGINSRMSGKLHKVVKVVVLDCY